MAKIQDIDIPYLEFAEAAAPGTGASAITRIYTKADGLMYSKDDAGVETLMSSGPAAGVAAGTGFPGSPANNDLFYRTDRDLLYFYDGTRWLTVTLYRGVPSLLVATNTTSGQTAARWAAWHTTYDLWLDTFYTVAYVATTNTGAAYWSMTLKKYQSDFSTSSTIANPNTSAQAPNVGVTAATAIGALLTPATYQILSVELVKTGSPGGITYGGEVSYRLVG